MNIIQIIAAYKPAYIYGGPTLSVARLCEKLYPSLKAEGHKLEVLATTANGSSELNVESGVQATVDGVPVTYFRRITKDHSHFSPSLLAYLRSGLRTNKGYNLVHIHAWWNFTSLFSCLVAKLNNTPVLLSPRGMLTSYTLGNRNSIYKRWLHLLLGKRLLQHCHFHATSEKEKRDILSIVNPKSIDVIFNLVNFPSLDPKNNIHSNSDIFRLLYLSRVEQKKGIEYLFRALATLNFDWTLSIAGSGADKYIAHLKKMAAQLKI
ncbi:MAG: hypothetical protein EOO43_07850, partial [Flavobacterium sp.]